MAGLTETGLVIESQEEILDGILAELRGKFGPSFAPEGTVVHFVSGVFSDRVADVWELLELLASSQDPDQATGAQQDALCALTGTEREGERASAVTLTLTGTPSTVVPVGSRASVASTGDEFETLADATIATLAAWAASTAYAKGARVTSDGHAWECTVAGTSHTSAGPSATGLAQGDTATDNTVTWKLLGQGTGAVDVEAEATETGPIVAVSGDITEIETPVSGWEAVINILDADVGSDVETDAELRVKREDELAAAGASTADAIRADLRKVEGVTSVTVFQNRTDQTDADGVPPHSVECLVRGGDDQAIGEALYRVVSGTSGTHGNVSVTVTDSEGNEHEIKFSRPDEVEVYVDVTLTYDPDVYPADGDDQVKAAIVAWGDARASGANAVASAIAARGFQVPGVLDVPQVFIGISPVPISSATIPITSRQLAVYDTSRITVNSSEGTP